MAGDERIHEAHCSAFRCIYGDPNCPVVEVEQRPGRSEKALAVLRDEDQPEAVDTPLTEEFAVRNPSSDWIYALPRTLPRALWGKRGTREAAEWHRKQVAGKNPEDQEFFEIVSRPVGPWKVVQ